MPAKAKLTTRQESTTQVSSDNFAKGSELTYAEADSNFINLRDQSFAISDGATTTDIEAGETITFSGASVSGNTVSITGGGGGGSVGDLTITGSTISSPSNGDLTLDPSGTGDIILSVDGSTPSQVKVGNGTAYGSITSNGNQQLEVSANGGGAAQARILLQNESGGRHILLDPGTSGKVSISGINHPTSDGTNGQVLTTDGAGNLSFSTVSVSTGDITFTGNNISTSSSNADLELAASGTGNIDLKARSVFVGDSSTDSAIISTETDRPLYLAQNMDLSSDFSSNAGGFIQIASNGTLTLRPANGNQYIYNEASTVYIGRSANANSMLSGFGRSATTLTTNAYTNGWEPRILFTPPGNTASAPDKALSKITMDAGDSGSGTLDMTMIKIFMSNLPTSDPTTAGQLWNDSGTLKISAG